MKTAITLVTALLLSFATMLSAQNDTRGSWKIERGSRGYKADDTPGKEEYKKGMDFYLGTNGQKRDYKKAVELLNISAHAGNHLALYQLGNCFYYGNGVKINKKRAAEYWQQSADKGCIEAMYELGNLYYKGDNVKRNYDTAIKLFRASAEKGNHAALYMIGECYWNGHGVDKDKNIAIDYWEKSAQKGNHKAREKVKEHSDKKKEQ